MRYKIGALILLMGSIALAGMGKGSRWMWDEDLDLSNEQIKKIQILQENIRLSKYDIQSEIKRMRIQLDQMENQSTPDIAAMTELLSDIKKQEVALGKMIITHRQKIKEILTEGQIIIFNQKYSDRGFSSGNMKMRGQGRGKRMNGGCSGERPYRNFPNRDMRP